MKINTLAINRKSWFRALFQVNDTVGEFKITQECDRTLAINDDFDHAVFR